MAEFKGIPLVTAKSGEKYVTPQGFTAIRDGQKPRDAAALGVGMRLSLYDAAFAALRVPVTYEAAAAFGLTPHRAARLRIGDQHRLLGLGAQPRERGA